MTAQSPNLIISQSANPYVGPRTFETADRQRYFGREAEATSLLGRVVSERLLLFYAQSGAGKSSLINARLIPALREEEGFSVLPVARVAGALPAGVEQVDNIFLFNLMASLDRAASDPGQFARLGLTAFLEHLVTGDGVTWRYDPAAAADVEEAPPVAEEESDAAAPAGRFALIVDQFEEIITGHPERWQEREEFFRQLDAALQANPNLWIVLSLREDYVAALDPYAPLVFNRLRARFYMERMSVDAALDAVRRPASAAGRPFAPGVAEQLVDNLRQVRVPGQATPVPGQYVEPVQLQVVCYQLWENLTGPSPSQGEGEITLEDLAAAGDVDRALTHFYEETLTLALADPAAAGVSERQVRTWFDTELITAAGTRGLVHQGLAETAGLPNAVVRALQRRFLVRGEARGGDTWIELVHDRFVEPIRASNVAWFPAHLTPLQRQAALWIEQGRSPGLLLRDAALTEAAAWAAGHEKEMQTGEREFLDACHEAQKTAERERLQRRRFLFLAIVAGAVAVLAIAAAIWGWNSRNVAIHQKKIADENAEQAVEARNTAEAQESLARAGTLIALADMALRIDDYNRAVLLTVESLRSALVKEALASALRTNLHPWHSVLYLDDSLYGPPIWSSDGARLVTGGADGNVNVWDTETGKQLMHLVGHDDAVTGIAWGHDETRVLTQSVDNTVRIWDMESGTEVFRLSFGADGAVHMVNSASGHDVFRLAEGIPDDFPNSRQFLLGEDGNHFVVLSGGGKVAYVWDLRSGEEVLRIEADDYGAGELVWNSRQNRIVAVSEDGTTRVWDTKGGAAPFIVRDTKDLFWNRDGSQAVAASEQGPAVLWDIERRQMLTTLNDFIGNLNAAAWSRDGSRIVTVSDDRSILVWDARNGERLNTINSPVDVLDIEWSQDDKNILAQYSTGHRWSGSEIRIWAADSGEDVITFPSQYEKDGSHEGRDLYLAGCNYSGEPEDSRDQMHDYGVVYGCEFLPPLWSQDGSRILDSREDTVNRGTLQLWNTDDGDELLRMAAFPPDEQRDFTQSISLSPTGGHILVYDGRTMELRALGNRDDNLNLHASYSQADADGFSVNGFINRSIGEEGLLGVNYFSQSLDEVFGLDKVDYPLSDETLADAHDRFRENLIADICSIVPRNMTWEEWQTTMRLDYRPTCPDAPIPPDAIWGIREQAAALAQTGDLASAADRVSELVGWLQENGQYDRFGSVPAEWLEALKAGRNPWATE